MGAKWSAKKRKPYDKYNVLVMLLRTEEDIKQKILKPLVSIEPMTRNYRSQIVYTSKYTIRSAMAI